MTRTIRVELGERSYEVHIGPGLLRELGPSLGGTLKPGAVSGLGVSSDTRHPQAEKNPLEGATRPAMRAVVISDSNVASLYGKAALGSLRQAGVTADLIKFPHGERNKTLATYGRIFDALFSLQPAVDRKTLVVALGGGVSGDLAGFVAATALRGLRFVQCPTTLLADVDAAVGGKTGVDHPAGKNLIGAFHQPRAVIIDVRTLKSLPLPELRNGLAECVKHAVIRDAAMLDWIESHAEAILRCDEDVMTELVARNVAIKAAVVSADELETGKRAHLNYGHTVGHALETLANYEMPHGSAVSLGMVAAGRLAARMGLIQPAYAARIESLLKALGLPVAQASVDVQAVLRVMQHDKKARDGKVRMVLPTGPEKVKVVDDIPLSTLAESVGSLVG